ncbi:ATP-dependent DNA helicase II subunit 1 [Malassezia vespertilionis]|uniref:ATP-dependent DNA helicase II subunit 1 n=1 Tax=Malassezia vespertilionis TaxID=2020962 RepID=UPI0024B1AC58|nr:ATP-dependent DNA helicase II subunit 1 [Malassezia vespertilionis]WFD07297.1 ATP-dependent DNA helicase II subunit 1 [Malassezia vespertilionis]
MHANVDGEIPLLTAFRAAEKLMENKLVSSPKDYVGIMLWNTAESKMTTANRGRYRPNTVEYTPIEQVNVPATYGLQQLLEANKTSSKAMEKRFAPAHTPMRIDNALANALQLLTTSVKAGTRRVFFITNQDDPFPGNDKKLVQKASIEKMKEFYRRGIDAEPFFLGSAAHPFQVNLFYAEIFGVYDDGLIEDALRPWRLRLLQDQNVSKVNSWDSTTKWKELDEQMDGRDMPKRVIFDLMLDLGAIAKKDADDRHAKAQSRWRIQVKGYALISEAAVEMPVRISSYGKEDPEDFDEVIAHQQVFDTTTGSIVRDAKPAGAYQVSSGSTASLETRIILSEDEIKALRVFGRVPGITLLGFKDISTLNYLDNVKHSYFIYPSDVEFPGSKCVFTALLHAMHAKAKYALALFMPRENVIPAFVALLPQAEEIDEDGAQIVPPGMNMIILPYADDLRQAPQAPTKEANAEEVSAAEKVIDSFLRKEPFNPDTYTNPVLAHHYNVLKAVAFERPLPPYRDGTVPEYSLIGQRSLHAIRAWNQAIHADPRTSMQAPKAEARAAHKVEPMSKERDAELRYLHQQGLLVTVRFPPNSHQLNVPSLRLACEQYGLPSKGRKVDLLSALDKYIAS